VAEPSRKPSDRPPPMPGFSRLGLFVGIVIVTIIGSGIVFLIGRYLR